MTARRLPALGAVLATGLAVVLLLSACAPPASGDAERRPGLRIAAASSLTGLFDELARAFAREHPEILFEPIIYEGSPTLAAQIRDGRRIDVIASADEDSLSTITDQIDGAPVVFATNVLVIAVPPGNPADIRTLADLSDDELTVVLCAEQVPCGASARALLSSAGVSVVAASEEQNVKAVVAKIQAGEADAGLVYATDVIASHGALEGIAVEGSEDARTEYPIAALTGSENPSDARAFVSWIRSAAAREVLARAGFGAP